MGVVLGPGAMLGLQIARQKLGIVQTREKEAAFHGRLGRVESKRFAKRCLGLKQSTLVGQDFAEDRVKSRLQRRAVERGP